MPIRALNSRLAGYTAAVAGIALVTAALRLYSESINSTTVALAMLLVVLFVAAQWGARPAIVGSVLGVFCFNFFFLDPLHTLTIADPDNWVALIAFLITAVTAGGLSARATHRAEEAEAGRREIERLYDELREAFERASQAEALRRSERLKSALLDAVTHDIRTPLTSIKASVTTLLDEFRGRNRGTATLDDEGRRDMLEVIDEEADRLNRFVEGLVELARIEAGDLELRRRWGTVDEIVMTALERAQPLTHRHKVEIAIEKDLPVVRVDAKSVAQVIYTLVDNASKYSPPGTLIRVAAARDEDEMVRLIVEDEGPGVPAELRERVFDKFFRAMRDGGSGTRAPGIGMGLAIARGIVEAHGGRIWIEDAPLRRGTRVVLTLPFGDEDEAERNAEVKIARLV